MFSGIDGSVEVLVSLSAELTSGRDSRMFLSDLTEADIVKITLIIINKVAVIAVKRDKRLADPRADIMPPRPPPPPPKPRPSLSEPCRSTKITKIRAGKSKK